MGAASALVAVFAVGACGDSDFENDPRPPSPIALSARIGDDEVGISPSRAGEVGAGLAVITISNQSGEPSRLVLSGPSDERSPEIVPGGVGDLKAVLHEGKYKLSAPGAGGARDGALAVGPKRETSQNQVLLP